MNTFKNISPALLAAVLFCLSTPLSKFFVANLNSFSVAGLLYLGSGLGLLILKGRRCPTLISELKTLPTSNRWNLIGAILSGGVFAPLALILGIKSGTSFEVSVLLNFEAVASTLIAWLIFKEHVDRHIWAGKAIIILGTILLIFQPETQFSVSKASLWVLLACILWGVDNSLTRNVDEISASTLVSIKGVIAGGTNLLIGFQMQGSEIRQTALISLLLIGFFSYGLSLVLFVKSLRLIGTSRTASYFATGPFFGMLASIIILGERPLASHWIAAGIILGGTSILFREKHEHEHTHEILIHNHKHIHDEHHQHEQAEDFPQAPHTHEHQHLPMKHSHAHFPDIHHRHSH